MFGPKRFSDLRASLPGISANVLTQRLEGLEAESILIRRKLPPPASAWVYELTDWGYELEPLFQVLGRWGARSPMHDQTRPFSAASLMLSFRTMIDSEKAAGIDAIIGFRVGVEGFVAQLRDGTIEIARSEPQGSDALFSGEARALAAIVYGGVPLVQAEASLGVSVTGDRALAERFISLFPLPAPASLATG